MKTEYQIEKVAFETKPDQGYVLRACYLKEPHGGDALITLFKDGKEIRMFLFPAYKIWNLSAHFTDIVDGEIKNDAHGYKMAAWDGVSGATLLVPKPATP